MRVRATLHGFPAPARSADGSPPAKGNERDLELPEGARADDAPRALGVRPELVLVFRDERPLPADEPLADGDHIRILRVVSGG